MAQADIERTFQAPIDKVYACIVDYASYPEFVDGVSSIKILEQNESGARVEYSLNMIKTFNYVLKLTHEKPNKVSWQLEGGDIFKRNNGSWNLSDRGDGTTAVKYELDVDFKGFAPKAIINKLVANNLPSMMDQYEKRAKSL
ncbi:MAG: SRPBCC family protein [Deltaproteobacteria bacterium]|nr:MAG: SRPBCC family protein [Deltaproteobacteria bacterium]TNF25094.1 MAG: SRPBCC family protein [Deltaproteobacteria bacterium]